MKLLCLVSIELLLQPNTEQDEPKMLFIFKFPIGNVTQVQDLIEEGADVNLVDGNGMTPLYIATFFSK